MRKQISALALVAFTVPVAAQFYDGNRLHELCSSTPAFAAGFVSGVIDREWLSATGVTDTGKPLSEVKSFCLPSTVTVTQVRDVVCKALDETPETRHWMAVMLASNALNEAYPCP